MATIVNVHQAEAQFSRLLKRAHEGEEIILSKAGKTKGSHLNFKLLTPVPKFDSLP